MTTLRSVRLIVNNCNYPVASLLFSELLNANSTGSIRVSVTESTDVANPCTIHLYASEKQPKPNVVDDAACCKSLGKLSAKELALWTPALDAEIEATVTKFDFSSASVGNPKFAQLMGMLNKHFELRTFIVGRSLTIADLCVFASLYKALGFKVYTEGLRKTFPFACRWFNFMHNMPFTCSCLEKYAKQWATDAVVSVSEASPAIATSTAASPSSVPGVVSPEQQRQEMLRHFASCLPNAVEGKIVTRFPPEPSGYLHIGHAKAALLNNFYASYFKGELLLRFDDTNPSKENVEFEDSILEDLKMLGIKDKKVSHTSDHFDRLIETATELIRNGKAYVDDTPGEQMRIDRGNCVESASRNNDVEKNLQLWQQMQEGTDIGLSCCLRAKIDMNSPNGCLRDPVLYRCNIATPHHRTGSKYKVYPTYDFCCPLVDSWEGVTHALRTSEYADRIPQYFWVQEACHVRKTEIYEFSRLNFVNTVLSKRRLQWLVDTGVVEGWDDPRFPTVRGIIRRGLTIDALFEFILEQGPSRNINLMEWDKLWSKNKQVLDPIVPRYMSVASEKCVRVKLSGMNVDWEVKERSLHPKNSSVGTTSQVYSNEILIDKDDAELSVVGEELTLMRWGNAILEEIVRDDNVITEIKARLNLEGDFKTTKRKIHWVAANAPNHQLVDLNLIEYDVLITKKKPEENDTMEDLVNRNSVFMTTAFGESQMRDNVKMGDSIQLERRGYYRCDKITTTEDNHAVLHLIKIPDGKSKPMSTLSTKVDATSLSRGK